MRKDRGPWAVRYFAGAVYPRDSGYLPTARDSASRPLALEAPTLFDGYFGAVCAEHPAVTPPPSQDDLEGNPRPTVHLSKAVPCLPEEIMRRRRRPSTQRSSPEAESNPAPPQSLHSISHHRGGCRADETPEDAYLNLGEIFRNSRRGTNPAPRRRILPAKLPLFRERASGQPARVVNFVLLPLIVGPAGFRPTAQRRILRAGRVIGNRVGARNGGIIFFYFLRMPCRSLLAIWIDSVRARYFCGYSHLRVILGPRTYFCYRATGCAAGSIRKTLLGAPVLIAFWWPCSGDFGSSSRVALGLRAFFYFSREVQGSEGGEIRKECTVSPSSPDFPQKRGESKTIRQEGEKGMRRG